MKRYKDNKELIQTYRTFALLGWAIIIVNNISFGTTDGWGAWRIFGVVGSVLTLILIFAAPKEIKKRDDL